MRKGFDKERVTKERTIHRGDMGQQVRSLDVQQELEKREWET